MSEYGNDKRADFERLARKLRDVCQEALEGGVEAKMILGALGAALTYLVAQIDPVYDRDVAHTLNGMVTKIMAEAADARKSATAQ